VISTLTGPLPVFGDDAAAIGEEKLTLPRDFLLMAQQLDK
jgi:hypothetical protein